MRSAVAIRERAVEPREPAKVIEPAEVFDSARWLFREVVHPVTPRRVETRAPRPTTLNRPTTVAFDRD